MSETTVDQDDTVTQSQDLSSGPRRLRSAMFVDFDNVYSGLQRLDADVAKAFANDPAHWVDRLLTGADADGTFTRRFLIRKCYLNPAQFSHYRPNFTRAGFQVVDCPSLTQQGKSSADINLVLDALDALAASTHFDEFVIFSADADFTPLIARCRAADRLATIVTSSPAAAAYRAVADTVLGVDALMALLEPPVVGETESPPDLLSTSDHDGNDEPPAIQVTGQGAAADAIRQFAETADGPVLLSSAAAVAIRAEPELPDSGWNGRGSFGGWLQSECPDLVVDTRTPGYLWDPSRFSEADLPRTTPAAAKLPELNELQRQVISITEIPALNQASYRTLLEQLAFDLALFPFSRTETSKRVRNECAHSDTPIGRGAINFVINGLLFAGADLEGEPPPSGLAAIWADNVLGLCRLFAVECGSCE